ncbi:quinic acid utilization activator [Decorospora gaudefroyi]|uniref:Quinic acid utilization activator n=1 Tax=Decorospora gaudefroyi TaxID=184978 RepID=A0A6A5KDV7_9PLEO|nr:quinic acid utilization activator [Decorospora gaudefroyi]
MSFENQEKRRLATRNAPAKRLRVSRACDQCRTAREKCDGNEPTCSPCLDTKRACTYTSNPKKRGLQPGYIRTLETTLALVFQQHTEIETLLCNQLAQENTALLARGTKESTRLHKSWMKSRFCREVTKALSGEPIGIADEKRPISDDDSEIDTEDANLFQMAPLAQPHTSTSWSSGARCIPQEPAMPRLPDLCPQITQQPRPSSELTTLPINCWKLLEAYWTYTQCWLPISNKLDIVKLSYTYPAQGLALSCDMNGSGSHAEMWSIFAVGSTQDYTSFTREDEQSISPRTLYDIARLLIPSELGHFDLAHVKALLNLAVFNISMSLLDAAWHLVSAASRVFLTIAESLDASVLRRRHVFSSCFVLDSLLALYLKRRPYLDRSDLLWVGKIEEDGMEEWQPWSGHLNLGPAHRSKLPTFALSTFNALTELVDILVSATRQPTARNFLHEMIGRLEMWKSSLPPKLDYIRNETVSTPSTPPALLLRLAYLATAHALVPSQARLQRILDILSALHSQLGLAKMPAIVVCLFQSIRRCSTSSNLDQATHNRMFKVFAAFDQAPLRMPGGTLVSPQGIPGTFERNSPDSHTMQISPQFFPLQLGGPIAERPQEPAGTSSILNGLLPDMNTNREDHSLPLINPSSFELTMDGAITNPLDPYQAFVSDDLGSVLDDFALEHGAKKLQNQPQFMQNLGFSTEVSMADLLAADPGRFMPTSSQCGGEDNDDPPHLSLGAFYEAG